MLLYSEKQFKNPQFCHFLHVLETTYRLNLIVLSYFVMNGCKEIITTVIVVNRVPVHRCRVVIFNSLWYFGTNGVRHAKAAHLFKSECMWDVAFSSFSRMNRLNQTESAVFQLCISLSPFQIIYSDNKDVLNHFICHSDAPFTCQKEDSSNVWSFRGRSRTTVRNIYIYMFTEKKIWTMLNVGKSISLIIWYVKKLGY